ncbi:Hypothetical_protein [Hexamita inflata]|uniref:Hypothetical_protein n=1 Tax=Hexamita inflata TaxID=28002 RepID=A0AA86RQQ2_9EUKA|nr:Hypothetical protein HINF_LOCUS58510 [Hexamita inflata]
MFDYINRVVVSNLIFIQSQNYKLEDLWIQIAQMLNKEVHNEQDLKFIGVVTFSDVQNMLMKGLQHYDVENIESRIMNVLKMMKITCKDLTIQQNEQKIEIKDVIVNFYDKKFIGEDTKKQIQDIDSAVIKEKISAFFEQTYERIEHEYTDLVLLWTSKKTQKTKYLTLDEMKSKIGIVDMSVLVKDFQFYNKDAIQTSDLGNIAQFFMEFIKQKEIEVIPQITVSSADMLTKFSVKKVDSAVFYNVLPYYFQKQCSSPIYLKVTQPPRQFSINELLVQVKEFFENTYIFVDHKLDKPHAFIKAIYNIKQLSQTDKKSVQQACGIVDLSSICKDFIDCNQPDLPKTTIQNAVQEFTKQFRIFDTVHIQNKIERTQINFHSILGDYYKKSSIGDLIEQALKQVEIDGKERKNIDVEDKSEECYVKLIQFFHDNYKNERRTFESLKQWIINVIQLKQLNADNIQILREQVGIADVIGVRDQFLEKYPEFDSVKLTTDILINIFKNSKIPHEETVQINQIKIISIKYLIPFYIMNDSLSEEQLKELETRAQGYTYKASYNIAQVFEESLVQIPAEVNSIPHLWLFLIKQMNVQPQSIEEFRSQLGIVDFTTISKYVLQKSEFSKTDQKKCYDDIKHYIAGQNIKVVQRAELKSGGRQFVLCSVLQNYLWKDKISETILQNLVNYKQEDQDLPIRIRAVSPERREAMFQNVQTFFTQHYTVTKRLDCEKSLADTIQKLEALLERNQKGPVKNAIVTFISLRNDLVRGIKIKTVEELKILEGAIKKLLLKFKIQMRENFAYGKIQYKYVIMGVYKANMVTELIVSQLNRELMKYEQVNVIKQENNKEDEFEYFFNQYYVINNEINVNTFWVDLIKKLGIQTLDTDQIRNIGLVDINEMTQRLKQSQSIIRAEQYVKWIYSKVEQQQISLVDKFEFEIDDVTLSFRNVLSNVIQKSAIQYLETNDTSNTEKKKKKMYKRTD